MQLYAEHEHFYFPCIKKIWFQIFTLALNEDVSSLFCLSTSFNLAQSDYLQLYFSGHTPPNMDLMYHHQTLKQKEFQNMIKGCIFPVEILSTEMLVVYKRNRKTSHEFCIQSDFISLRIFGSLVKDHNYSTYALAVAVHKGYLFSQKSTYQMLKI